MHESEITVGLSLPRSSVKLGGAISGRFTIENPRLVDIAQARVSLDRCEWVRLGSSKVDRQCVSSLTITPKEPGSPRVQADFDLSVPAGAPPTVEGTAISVIWLLRLCLDTTPPIELKTPVTVFAPAEEWEGDGEGIPSLSQHPPPSLPSPTGL